jgi:LCP family protein required for cell wall assembly
MEKEKRKLKISFKIIVQILAIISSIFVIGVIVKLNLIPIKYFIGTIIIYILINAINYLLIRMKKKPIRIIGIILSIILTIINIVASIYMIRTDSFLSTSFDNAKKSYTVTYYVLSNKQNDYKLKDIKDKDVSYYSDSNEIDNALTELKKSVSYNANSYSDLNKMFTDLKDNTIDFALIDSSSYDLVLLLDNSLSKSDYNVVYQFDLSFDEEESLNLSNVSDTFNIYIAGKDFTYTNNDFNMVVSVNLKTRKILLTSMPRDFYIEVYGKDGRKDTLSYMGAYGTTTSLRSLEKLLDIDINYYVEINTKSLVGLVDALGGITYCSNEEYTTTHALILDSYDDTKGDKFHVQKGCQELNGIETLTVSRERLNIVGGDTQRQKNCELIMEEILDKLKSTNTITNFGNVLSAISDLYKTNMPKETFTKLVKDILDNSNWTIDKYSLDGMDTKNYVHLSNLIDWINEPDYNTIEHDKELIQELMN